jgi:phosphopantothenoylcysteine decarboxylase/phosphopantothenate--cysteine ligase
VRYITNHSSGKMGYAVALMAKRRGAEVTLISGPTELAAPKGVRCISVTTAIEMRDAVLGHLEESTVVIKTAAVADYRPEECRSTKIKKSKKGERLTVHLEMNPDILAAVAEKKGSRIVVGFAMETEHLLERAREKLIEKGLDCIVANDLTVPGAGFRTDTNVIRILDREGGDEIFPLMDKLDVAGVVLDKVKWIRDHNRISDEV